MSTNKERRLLKSSRLNRGSGVPTNKLFGQKGRQLEVGASDLVRKTKSAVELLPQTEILEREDDLSMLILNEQQYSSALIVKQTEQRSESLLRSWGAAEEQLTSMESQPGDTGADVLRRNQVVISSLIRGDLKRGTLFRRVAAPYTKVKTFYKDEIDQLIAEEPELFSGLPHREILSEQIRSQGETLALIRMQIDFLKKKRKQERAAAQTPKKDRTAKPEVVPEQSVPELVVGKEEIAPAPVEVFEEPFGLSGWQVFWTDVKFSTNPNQLIELPTDSREVFFKGLDEINSGRKHFQIKTGSVASCIEMWAIPEFRRRALMSRFNIGPDYVRQWSKLVRGPVRIMVNSDEQEKRLVFFAADRDEVYRHVFAGMSS